MISVHLIEHQKFLENAQVSETIEDDHHQVSSQKSIQILFHVILQPLQNHLKRQKSSWKAICFFNKFLLSRQYIFLMELLDFPYVYRLFVHEFRCSWIDSVIDVFE